MNYRTVDHGWFGRSMVIWWKVPVIWRWISWMRVPSVYLRTDDPWTLVHEMVHVPQCYKAGAFRWIFGHLFSASYRLKHEGPATAAVIKAKVDTGGYEPAGLIAYYAAIYPQSYRLGSKWSTEELVEILEGYYDEVSNA